MEPIRRGASIEPRKTPRTERTMSTTSTHQPQPSATETGARTFFALLDHAFAATRGQTLMSQTRCVDHYLDLWGATDNAVLHGVLAGALEEVRRVTAVRSDDVHAALSVIAAAADVELTVATA
jgi:hypothetical protein